MKAWVGVKRSVSGRMSLAMEKKTEGSSRKMEMSKTSWGSLSPRCASLEYSPVSLDRKSGMPREVEIPAPVRTMIFLAFLIRDTASSTVLYCGSLILLESSRLMARPRSV